MGEIEVPESAYFGAQTARAVENFPISGLRFPRRFIHALGLVKRACARANMELGDLNAELGVAIERAAAEVAEGRLDGEFVVDIFQTGSGTSTNMNANEVIANRSAEILGHGRASRIVHPNDHVNMSQSSNDVIPTAMHIAATLAINEDLLPALDHLKDALLKKSVEFDQIVKTGRTHLMDATPIRMGQEFSGYAVQVAKAADRIRCGRDSLLELALGGTAVGTGINRRTDFPSRAIGFLARETGISFREAENHFEAQAARDAFLEVSGNLRGLACSLIKIANDIRWMASGPRAGLAEVRLPAIQPGSSIMPGKVNPVICEAVIMVAAQVIGYDATIAVCGMSGNLELNVMMPVMTWDLLHAIELLSSASRVFVDKCILGMTADEEKCRRTVESTTALATALAPLIGYDRAAEIAKEAYRTGRTVREIARESEYLPDEELDAALDPARMTEPAD